MKHKGYRPMLDVAKQAVWFYYEQIVAEERDLSRLPSELESSYQQCLRAAEEVYSQFATMPKGARERGRPESEPPTKK